MTPPGRSAPYTPVAAAEARAHMVEEQLHRRGVTDERILAAMGKVPRDLFLPEDLRRFAYEDGAFPIGFGQTISQPFIVGTICQLLSLSGTVASGSAATSRPTGAGERGVWGTAVIGEPLARRSDVALLWTTVA